MKIGCFVLGTSLAWSLTACGQVEHDPSGATPGPNRPEPSPPLAPKSAVCPSAAIKDALGVALSTTRGQDLVFVRHDGSELVAHRFVAKPGYGNLSVHASATRIVALMAEHYPVIRSELVLFDRRGAELDSLVVDRALSNSLVTDDGSVLAAATSGDVAITWRWSGKSLVEIAHGWMPIGVAGDGFVAMRAGSSVYDPHGFLDTAANTIEVFAGEGEPIGLAAGRLVTLDAEKQHVLIGAPHGDSSVSIGEYAGALGGELGIDGIREEGWISVEAQPNGQVAAARTALVINVVSGAKHFVQGPPDAGDTLAMYCDGARRGYLASDGALLFSKIEADGLHVLRYPADGGAPAQIGKPLTKIALLGVVERAGGFIVMGSDGSDTYCGSPDSWPVPTAPGAEPGDSVFGGRIGTDSPLFELPFGGTWFEHDIDKTGSCAIGPGFSPDNPSLLDYRVDDLTTGSVFEVPVTDSALRFID